MTTIQRIYLAVGAMAALAVVGVVVLHRPQHMMSAKPPPNQPAHAMNNPTPTPVPAPLPPVSPSTPVDCAVPTTAPPAAPDGATATAAEMKQAHDAIQSFVDALEAYQSCRNNQVDHAAPDTPAAQKQNWIDQGNGAVDEANLLARAFAVQMQAFKAAHPGP